MDGYLQIGALFLAASGAALFLGTGAALLTYRRTGAFPGQPADDPAAPSVRTAVVKVVLGAALIALGLVAYAAARA